MVLKKILRQCRYFTLQFVFSNYTMYVIRIKNRDNLIWGGFFGNLKQSAWTEYPSKTILMIGFHRQNVLFFAIRIHSFCLTFVVVGSFWSWGLDNICCWTKCRERKTFSFLETSAFEPPIWNLWASRFQKISKKL